MADDHFPRLVILLASLSQVVMFAFADPPRTPKPTKALFNKSPNPGKNPRENL